MQVLRTCIIFVMQGLGRQCRAENCLVMMLMDNHASFVTIQSEFFQAILRQLVFLENTVNTTPQLISLEGRPSSAWQKCGRR